MCACACVYTTRINNYIHEHACVHTFCVHLVTGFHSRYRQMDQSLRELIYTIARSVVREEANCNSVGQIPATVTNICTPDFNWTNGLNRGCKGLLVFEFSAHLYPTFIIHVVCNSDSSSILKTVSMHIKKTLDLWECC